MNKAALFVVLNELRDRLTVSFSSMTYDTGPKHEHLLMIDHIIQLSILLEEDALDTVWGDSTVNMLVTSKAQEWLQKDNNELRATNIEYRSLIRKLYLDRLEAEYNDYTYYVLEEEYDEDGGIDDYYVVGVEPRGQKAKRTREYNKARKRIEEEWK